MFFPEAWFLEKTKNRGKHPRLFAKEEEEKKMKKNRIKYL